MQPDDDPGVRPAPGPAGRGARPAHHPRPARPPARGPRPAVTCCRRCSVRGRGRSRPAAPPGRTPLPRRNPGRCGRRGDPGRAGNCRRRTGRQCGPRRTALRKWGRTARAWPSVYVCACQSTLTDRSPLVRPRPRHRPLPLPIGRFEHKGPGSPRPPRGPGGRGKSRQESARGRRG